MGNGAALAMMRQALIEVLDERGDDTESLLGEQGAPETGSASGVS